MAYRCSKAHSYAWLANASQRFHRSISAEAASTAGSDAESAYMECICAQLICSYLQSDVAPAQLSAITPVQRCMHTSSKFEVWKDCAPFSITCSNMVTRSKRQEEAEQCWSSVAHRPQCYAVGPLSCSFIPIQ